MISQHESPQKPVPPDPLSRGNVFLFFIFFLEEPLPWLPSSGLTQIPCYNRGDLPLFPTLCWPLTLLQTHMAIPTGLQPILQVLPVPSKYTSGWVQERGELRTWPLSSNRQFQFPKPGWQAPGRGGRDGTAWRLDPLFPGVLGLFRDFSVVLLI